MKYNVDNVIKSKYAVDFKISIKNFVHDENKSLRFFFQNDMKFQVLKSHHFAKSIYISNSEKCINVMFCIDQHKCYRIN